jgi:hypothetical protein
LTNLRKLKKTFLPAPATPEASFKDMKKIVPYLSFPHTVRNFNFLRNWICQELDVRKKSSISQS